MAYQTPISIKQAVEHINRRECILPDIQREFVWTREQMIRLLDSIMKDYPIGSFLFWKVKSENRSNYQFYGFIQNYHERDFKHNPPVSLDSDNDVLAVLDGQQRLTSLCIGLTGYHAEKRRYGRWNNDDAFPVCRLYFNLTRQLDDVDLTYDFRFRSDSENFIKDEEGGWIRVGKVLEFSQLTDVINFLREHDLLAEQLPQDLLSKLYHNIMERTIINYYVEEEQDLDKVLNIFIRVNSAGTVLGYSDLLLSMATAEWTTYDAREEINRLVEYLNDNETFEFTKDFVLKACLMTANLPTRFATVNFTAENMQKIELIWSQIASACRITTRLLADFGFTGATLPSINAVLPIVYYVFIRDNPNNFLESSNFKTDRHRIKRWLCKALLKRIFSGQPDSTLQPIREAIRNFNTEGFPSEQIEQTLRSRTMQFTSEEVEEILEEKYGSGYTFSVLTLLYPWIDYSNRIHQDHIHPKSRFTKGRLKAKGFSDDETKVIQGQVNQIPNLQLLQGTINTEKSNKSFNEWLNEQYPLEDERHYYMSQHYVPDEDSTIEKFPCFFEARRELMKKRLYEIVGFEQRG
jgi:hypothetical protein